MLVTTVVTATALLGIGLVTLGRPQPTLVPLRVRARRRRRAVR